MASDLVVLEEENGITVLAEFVDDEINLEQRDGETVDYFFSLSPPAAVKLAREIEKRYPKEWGEEEREG
jgi:hypothetical protein